jgi:hypothetical protein
LQFSLQVASPETFGYTFVRVSHASLFWWHSYIELAVLELSAKMLLSETGAPAKVRQDKVKSSPCLTKYFAMKKYGRVEALLHAFLTSALDGGEWSASRPARFTPRERATGTHWTGGWLDPRAELDAVAK